MSGFQSAKEREVLDFLLRGSCGVVCVLARAIYKTVPTPYRPAFEAARMLFVSHESAVRADRAATGRRSALIADMRTDLVFTSVTSVTPASSLHPITLTPHARLL